MSKSNQGWICPKCGRVYAPWVPSCDTCNKQSLINQNTAPSSNQSSIGNQMAEERM